MNCKDCKHWIKQENFIPDLNFHIGICNKEADDTRSMKPDQMAITCGHDGPIYTGELFVCNHFENIDPSAIKWNDTSLTRAIKDTLTLDKHIEHAINKGLLEIRGLYGIPMDIFQNVKNTMRNELIKTIKESIK